MQFTLQNVSNPHQIWSAEASFRPVPQDRDDIPADTGEMATDIAEYEPAAFAGLIDELMDFKVISMDDIRDIERRAITDLGPQRFAQVKAVLLRAWQSDRMI